LSAICQEIALSVFLAFCAVAIFKLIVFSFKLIGVL
jgi:hypothetical protein